MPRSHFILNPIDQGIISVLPPDRKPELGINGLEMHKMRQILDDLSLPRSCIQFIFKEAAIDLTCIELDPALGFKSYFFT